MSNALPEFINSNTIVTERRIWLDGEPLTAVLSGTGETLVADENGLEVCRFQWDNSHPKYQTARDWIEACTKEAAKAETERHGHRIEQHVKVYLTLSDDGTRWELDTNNFDGHPLDGLAYGPQPSESDCLCGQPELCIEAHNRAALIPLPTGQELFTMIANYAINTTQEEK